MKELLKGNTEVMLLTLLQRQPMYGYQIAKELERRSQGYFRLSEGTLYPALRRLEKQGLVHSWWERSPSGQQRRYYLITEKGRKVLEIKTREWHSFVSALNLVLQPAK